MSSQQTRELVEKLKYIGYSNEIPQTIFNYSNFKALSEILEFLMNILSQESLPNNLFDCYSETKRVEMIKTVTELLVTKYQLIVNPKKLYHADRDAIGELLKIVDLVYYSELAYKDDGAYNDSTFLSTGYEPAGIRDVLKSLVSQSQVLNESIDNEFLNARSSRNAKLKAQIDTATLEKLVLKEVENIKAETENYKIQLDDILLEEEQLKSKLDSKKQELERREKRLKSLKSVRPAFMDEYEKIESEADDLYSDLVVDYGNFEWMRHKMSELDLEQKRRKDEERDALKQWLANLEQDEGNLMNSDSFVANKVPSRLISNEEGKPSGSSSRESLKYSRSFNKTTNNQKVFDSLLVE